MATQVQLRRGTAAQNDAFTGAVGEVTVDTDNDTLRVHDGGTAGGYELAKSDSQSHTNIDINSGTIDGVTIGGASAGAITGTTITGTSFVSSGNMSFGDNDKAIFGAGSDLQIYHDGLNSNIKDVGTGPLKIFATDLYINNSAGNKTHLSGIDGGAVTAYYNGAAKLATTATGVDVTGTVTADGLTVDGDATISSESPTAVPTLTLKNSDGTRITKLEVLGINTELSNTTGGNLRFRTNASELERMRISPDGDISFYEDTGTTPKFFWDASAESLGIGTGNPLTKFHVLNGSDSKGFFLLQGADTTTENLAFGVEAGESTITAGGSGSTSNALVLRTSDTGNEVERLRITSSGDVGIGTSSIDARLHIERSVFGGYNALQLENPNGNAAVLNFVDLQMLAGGSTGKVILRMENSSASGVTDGELAIHTTSGGTTAERLRIDASGNVGIGTSSPNNYSANHKSITLNAPTTPLIDLEVNGTRTGSFVADSTKVDLNAVTSVPLRFLTADTERARIDASGNLLVGTTSLSASVVGGRIFSGGRIVTSTTSEGHYFRRNSTDGTIVEFAKDGSTVGSIGTNSGVATFSGNTYASFGSGDVGLFANPSNNALYPVVQTTLAGSNGLIDLGLSGNRFKNLYLSGGVYLGGTGAANYLDDYEEGTWTPNATGSTSGVGGSQSNVGFYRKIGGIVTVWVETSFSKNTISGDLYLTGLPFVASGVGTYGPSNAINGSWAFTGDLPRTVYASNGTTLLRFWDVNTNNITDADLNTSAQNRMIFSLTYFTSA